MAEKQTFTVEQIRTFVGSRVDWAEKAIVRLYEQQTPQEQDQAVTAYKNNRGFSGVDAEILTSFAKQILSKKLYEENHGRVYHWGSKLSTKQFALAYKRLPKYATQLYRLAYGTEPKPAPKASEPEVSLERTSRKAREEKLEEKSRFAELERQQEEAAFASDPDYRQDVAVAETVLVDGRSYWLGACSGTYDRRNDCFLLGNCWVDRHETIYAKSPVSEMSDYRS